MCKSIEASDFARNIFHSRLSFIIQYSFCKFYNWVICTLYKSQVDLLPWRKHDNRTFYQFLYSGVLEILLAFFFFLGLTWYNAQPHGETRREKRMNALDFGAV